LKNDHRAIPVQADRMLADLQTIRQFGACGNGVVRRAYSDLDIASRVWLARRMEEAGLEVSVDAMGNVFGIPPGDGPCLLLGSHTDTQPEGGWLDGVYGVIVALEVARASIEAGGPRIACVSFQDEEGSFTPSTGSRVWTGSLTQEVADTLVDDAGTPLAVARQKRGALPVAREVSPSLFSGFVEMHIEQGPVLDRTGEKIGVVDSIVGIRGQRVTFTGEQNHAGTTPMQMRRDAFQGMVRFVTVLNDRFKDVVGPTTVWTIGQANVHPNATSIVPGKVDFWVQWRDGDDALLDRMHEIIDASAADIAAEMQLTCEISSYSKIAPTLCFPAYIAAMSEAAEARAPGRWRVMPSGALHDAANVSVHMPMGMMFVPSINGISHNFDEDTAIPDLEIGLEVFAEAIARIAAG
jgi:N-carbamoyl-L-amino-acid hydrolase